MGRDRRSSLGEGGGERSYCANCGTRLEPSMNYCPDCGTPSGRAAAHSHVDDETNAKATTRSAAVTAGVNASRHPNSSETVTDRNVLEHRIATAVRDGWELEHDFGDHAVLVRRTFGSADEHLVVALITIWFTGGLGNVLYGAYRYFGDAERMVLRADRVEGREFDAATSTTGSALLWRATAVVCWLAAAIIAVVGAFVGVSAASLVLFALAFVFVAMGVSVLPSVRRRLENRHAVTANGRVHSVDERTVVAYDRPCAACADPVGHGIERTYRRELCVLGVALTASEGRNYYCKPCATAEFSTADATDRRRTESSSPEPDLADQSAETEIDAGTDRDREPDHA